MDLTNKVVVVTGGAGFVGSHLCDRLIDSGNRVICVDNLVGADGSTRNIDHLLSHPGFEFINSSVVDWAATADLRDVSCVFHQAASKNTVCMKNPELDLEVNALGTLRLLQAAVRGIVDFNIDNSKILSLGMKYNTDWRSVVRETIDSMRLCNTDHRVA